MNGGIHDNTESGHVFIFEAEFQSYICVSAKNNILTEISKVWYILAMTDSHLEQSPLYIYILEQ